MLWIYCNVQQSSEASDAVDFALISRYGREKTMVLHYSSRDFFQWICVLTLTGTNEGNAL
jgi:hypothetical protein